MKQFLNRTAIVTGAGGGVGRGIALALAAAGANVVIAARRQSTGDETAALIAAEGGAALTLQTDVGRRGDVAAMAEAALSRFGGIDFLVHNAASGLSSRQVKLEDVTDADWDEQGGVALNGALYLAQACHPALKRSGAGAYIILTSSQGMAGVGRNPAYATFKAAQRGFIKSLSFEWGPDDITVNGLAPMAESDGSLAHFAANPGLRERLEQTVPMRRIGSPQGDIGEAVVALCGPGGRFITGQTIGVNGGTYTAL